MVSKTKLPTKGIDMSNRDDRRRAFAAVSKGLAVLCFAAVSGFAHGCSDIVVQPIGKALSSQPGNIGDPCIPDPEKNFVFANFNLGETTLVSNDFNACETGLCLINHFQGRVSCPLGQAAPKPCNGPADATTCDGGQACVEAGTVTVYCDPAQAGQCEAYGGVCNAQRGACDCSSDAQCPEGTTCDVATKECKRYVCHAPGACQSPRATDEENAGKACCTPDTDMPVATAVCGQCDSTSKRDAVNAVYCTCRCGPADGAPPEEDADYCTCPDGFECKEVIPYFGLGNPQDTGKFCVKPGTQYQGSAVCGIVNGYADPSECKGVPAP
jgi:hypothetical protein